MMKLAIWIAGSIGFALLCEYLGIDENIAALLGVVWGATTGMILLMWARS